MIIKSLGRKASSRVTGMGAKGGGPFARLVDYMTRSNDHEASESVLWHGFYGHAGMSNADIVHEFQMNAKRLKERKNGNILYHEMLSFSTGYKLEGQALTRAIADIGQEYLRLRASKQMAFGAVHFDTDHIHLHLLLSANEVGKPNRVRLAKKDFSDIQKAVEAYTLAHYPELSQTRVYDKDPSQKKSKERLKTQAHEQAMKARTGTMSRKEALKNRMHQFFEQAQSVEELKRLFEKEGVNLYTRGKSVGILFKEPDGQERRHRLSTLGLEEHYRATNARLEGMSKTQDKQEPDVSQKHPFPPGKDAFSAGKTPSAIEVVEWEFFTGKLHEHWHGPQPTEPEPKAPPPAYTDDILKRAQERDAERQNQAKDKGKNKDRDSGFDR